MTTALEKLKEVGFVLAGKWYLENDVLMSRISMPPTQKEILYAFVADSTVLYVGKSIKGLVARMGQYRKPGPSQITNQALNRNLAEFLRQGNEVDIWVFVESKPIKYGEFVLNLPAGLEDNIISVLNPQWNGANRKLIQEVSSQ